jgi:hypothetical protein
MFFKRHYVNDKLVDYLTGIITPDGVQHPIDIINLWTDEELAEAGIVTKEVYIPVDDKIPEPEQPAPPAEAEQALPPIPPTIIKKPKRKK